MYSLLSCNVRLVASMAVQLLGHWFRRCRSGGISRCLPMVSQRKAAREAGRAGCSDGLQVIGVAKAEEKMPMSQRTTGLYRAITYPRVYKMLMEALGADAALRRWADILATKPGIRLLDVGCGTANIRAYLSDIDYVGIDLNPRHIAFAKARYGNAGTFLVGDASSLKERGSFDLISASALLHHLNDNQARQFFQSLAPMLRSDGRIVTLDPVWLPQQRIIGRILKAIDSGKHIRTQSGYLALLNGLPFTTRSETVHDLLRIPYDHFIMTITKMELAS
jgi:SAM-dependent methyltransferase